MTTSQMIADFTTLAIQAGGWMELDRLYLQNRLLSMIGEQELGEVDIRPVATPAADLAEQLCQVASANQLVKTEQQKEQFMVQLMDLLTPPPSVVNAFCTTLCQRATRGYRVFLPTLSKTVRSLNRKNLLFFNSLW